MTAFDEPRINVDVLITHVYEMQVDLRLFQSYLATEPNPPLSDRLLYLLASLHSYLDNLAPSHARH